MVTHPIFAAISRIYRMFPPLRASAFTGQTGLGFFCSPLPGLRQQSEKLICRQRRHPEHQVRHHFRISFDPDMPAAEIILQPPIRPFRTVPHRSAPVRSLYRCASQGANSIFSPRRGLWSISGTCPKLRLCSRNTLLQ